MREVQRAGWRTRAACAGVATEIFYPEPSTPETKADATAICARCEVRLECLAEAIVTNERFGIRGGLTARQRRTMAWRLRRRHDERRAPAAGIAFEPARRSHLAAVDSG
jgi:WhiB family redox-sensing transcriptional regulator